MQSCINSDGHSMQKLIANRDQSDIFDALNGEIGRNEIRGSIECRYYI